MPLFHYTSTHFMPKIRILGLRKGVLPWNTGPSGRPGFVAGWQWLTENGDFNQAWAQPLPFSKLPFRRDEFRITIDIPRERRVNLIPWRMIRDKYHPDSEEFIESFHDAKFWHLYAGFIPPSWFVAIERNPLRPPDVSDFLKN